MSIFDIFMKKKQTSKTSLADITSTVLSLEKNELVMDADGSLESIPADASKIGGKPWLPANFEWPIFTDDDKTARPLSFLCQINLSEVKQYDRDGLLPDHGMLYFFYDCEAFRWGFDPEDDGCARVFYFENTDNFVSLDLPECIFDEYRIPEIAVRFSTQKSYPNYEELEIHSDLNCDWEAYDKVLTTLGYNIGTECNKLLGYADIIQNEMLSECERVGRGLAGFIAAVHHVQAVGERAHGFVREAAERAHMHALQEILRHAQPPPSNRESTRSSAWAVRSSSLASMPRGRETPLWENSLCRYASWSSRAEASCLAALMSAAGKRPAWAKPSLSSREEVRSTMASQKNDG